MPDQLTDRIRKAEKEYLLKCQEHCTSRLSDPYFFERDSLQANALRVESIRDCSPRCGEKPPEHWPESAKRLGWGRWIFSGGSAAVYGHCNISDCPLRKHFLRHAPRKEIRAILDKEAAPCPK